MTSQTGGVLTLKNSWSSRVFQSTLSITDHLLINHCLSITNIFQNSLVFTCANAVDTWQWRGSTSSRHHKLLWIAVCKWLFQCKVVCVVNLVWNPFSYLAWSWSKLWLFSSLCNTEINTGLVHVKRLLTLKPLSWLPLMSKIVLCWTKWSLWKRVNAMKETRWQTLSFDKVPQRKEEKWNRNNLGGHLDSSVPPEFTVNSRSGCADAL